MDSSPSDNFTLMGPEEGPLYPAAHEPRNPVFGGRWVQFWEDEGPVDLAPYLAMSEGELERQIDTLGWQEGRNWEMTLVAYHLAYEYERTGNETLVRRAAILLLQYAKVLRRWPYQRGEKSFPHDYRQTYYMLSIPPRYAGIWSHWCPHDLSHAKGVVLAWDLIRKSDAFDRLGEERGIDARHTVECDLLDYTLQLDALYPLWYGNTEANRIAGYLVWGMALDRPGLVHRGVRIADAMWEISFYPDGSWHEGSPGYHLLFLSRFAQFIPDAAVPGYSDPPGYIDPVDGTRFDNLDLNRRYTERIGQAAQALRAMVLPNSTYVSLHDTPWGLSTDDNAWRPLSPLRNYRRTRSEPTLMTWMGHGILGHGTAGDQVQAHLHYSGTNGHEHLDNLSILLFAKGEELLSENTYSWEFSGSRAWNTSTAAHNTVVVDERDQLLRATAPPRPQTALDDMSHIEGFELARWVFGHGACLTDGRIGLWEASDNEVQAIEVDSERAYIDLSLYRRTLALVTIDGNDVYLIDIFRVKGGEIHDWMLHGPLHTDYEEKVSIFLMAQKGTRHEFITDLRSTATDDSWHVDFIPLDGPRLRTTMLGAVGTEVTLGRAPATRRKGEAIYLDVRRRGSESTFIAIHEPYASVPRIHAVRALPATGSDGAVALQVDLGDRVDTFLSNLDASGQTEAERFELHGHIGFVRQEAQRVVDRRLFSGTGLRVGEGWLRDDSIFKGTIVEIWRSADGDPANAFITAAVPPEDEALVGRTLITEDGESSTKAFTITRVEYTADGQVALHVAGDPGMAVHEDHVKLRP